MSDSKANPNFNVETFFRLQYVRLQRNACWLNVNLQAMKAFPITRKKILEAFEVTRRSSKIGMDHGELVLWSI